MWFVVQSQSSEKIPSWCVLDHIILSAVLELRRGKGFRKSWILSTCVDAFVFSGDALHIMPKYWWYQVKAKKCNREHVIENTLQSITYSEALERENFNILAGKGLSHVNVRRLNQAQEIMCKKELSCFHQHHDMQSYLFKRIFD